MWNRKTHNHVIIIIINNTILLYMYRITNTHKNGQTIIIYINKKHEVKKIVANI